MLTRLARLYDSKQELEHVVRTYLKEVHDRHVKNDERDEFIDEIV